MLWLVTVKILKPILFNTWSNTQKETLRVGLQQVCVRLYARWLCLFRRMLAWLPNTVGIVPMQSGMPSRVPLSRVSMLKWRVNDDDRDDHGANEEHGNDVFKYNFKKEWVTKSLSSLTSGKLSLCTQFKQHTPTYRNGWRVADHVWLQRTRSLLLLWSDVSKQTLHLWRQREQTPSSASGQLRPDQHRLNFVRSLPWRLRLDQWIDHYLFQQQQKWLQTLSTSVVTNWPVERIGAVKVWTSRNINRYLTR